MTSKPKAMRKKRDGMMNCTSVYFNQLSACSFCAVVLDTQKVEGLFFFLTIPPTPSEQRSLSSSLVSQNLPEAKNKAKKINNNH